jgi:hypothetical protein
VLLTASQLVNGNDLTINSNDPLGYIWAPAYVAPTPGSTPEPATMALAGSALLALGFARRKFSAKK